MRDNELKLESARTGDISNHILSRASNSGKPEVFFAVSTKQQSRLKYSQSLMSISLEGGLVYMAHSRAFAHFRRIVQSGNSPEGPQPNKLSLWPDWLSGFLPNDQPWNLRVGNRTGSGRPNNPPQHATGGGSLVMGAAQDTAHPHSADRYGCTAHSSLRSLPYACLRGRGGQVRRLSCLASSAASAPGRALGRGGC